MIFFENRRFYGHEVLVINGRLPEDDGTGIISIEAYQEACALASEYIKKYQDVLREKLIYQARAESRKRKLKKIAAPMIEQLKTENKLLKEGKEC